jgi:hypothetical protein
MLSSEQSAEAVDYKVVFNDLHQNKTQATQIPDSAAIVFEDQGAGLYIDASLP